MNIKVKKINENAIIPKYATLGAACFDLTAVDIDHTEDQIKYDTGLAFEIPEGYVGLLFPRSSVVKTNMRLGNCVGIIDSDYRGSVSLVFDILDVKGQFYQIGDRVGQMMVLPVQQVIFEETQVLNDTSRGTGGYGSTGN